MFRFLKDKIKGVVGTFSKKVEAEEKKQEPEKRVERLEAAPDKKKAEVVERAVPQAALKKDEKKVEKKQVPEAKKEEAEERKGFFGRITDKVTKIAISEQRFDELFYDLEVALLEGNVAVEVIDKIKADLKARLIGKPIARARVNDEVTAALKSSIADLFRVEQVDLFQRVKEKKPFVILFVGINGSGKTTTIAKVASLLKAKGIKPVIAASDTFRAAAIQQLEEHAARLGVRLIKQDYGADPAAVAFDAIRYAEAHNIDVVLIDTAGRLHSNVNLTDEMKKIVRVSKPDMKIFVGESITGNDCVEQARSFNEAIGIDGIILAKADVDEKGGAAISVSYVTNKPILFLGVGQGYSDLQPFSPQVVMDSLGLD